MEPEWKRIKNPRALADRVISLQRKLFYLFTAGITRWKFSLVKSFVLHNFEKLDIFPILSIFVTAIGLQLIIDIPHWNSNKSLENQMLTFPIKWSLSFQHFFLRKKKSKKGKGKANYVWMSQIENTTILRKSTYFVVTFIRFPKADSRCPLQWFANMTAAVH